MDRNGLLNEINAGRTRLESALSRLKPAQMTDPDLPGGWSVKDLLAHFGWWERWIVEYYQKLVKGDLTVRPLESSEVDIVNAQVLEQFRAMDLDQVRSYERAGFQELLRLAETAPATDLFDAQRFSVWTNGEPFFEWVLGNSSGHYEEHWSSLESKLAEKTPGVAEPNPAVRRAKEFLWREGRDIDQALFDFRFGALSTIDVLEVLAHYQNVDGGFSRLEIDIQAPQSNPFATELALTILTWLDPPRDHPLVQRMMNYLEDSQDTEGNWRFSPEIYQHGLAPWFQGWQWPNLNPSCTIAGLLKQLGLGSDRLHSRVQALFNRLALPADLIGNEYYNVRPYAYYLQTEWNFPQADLYRWGVVWWLISQHENKSLDATHFADFLPRPESAIAHRLPQDVLSARLDQLLTEQGDDGGWPTPYDPRWRPWNTVHNLLILRAYGRV